MGSDRTYEELKLMPNEIPPLGGYQGSDRTYEELKPQLGRD